MKATFLLLLLGWCMTSAAVAESDQDVQALKEQVNRLIYSAKYDSAQSVTLTFLEQEHLSDLERFHAHHLYAETIRASGRPQQAIAVFQQALKIAEELPDNAQMLSKAHMSLANAYFDIPDYDMARDFAEKSVQLVADPISTTAGHATNFLIIGYHDFLNKRFASAQRYYEQAKQEYLAHDGWCELPLVYTKLAELSGARNEQTEALAFIDSARQVSSECDILLYRFLSEATLYRIHRNNGEYKKAVIAAEEMSRLEDEMRFHEQQMRMESMERAYEERLQQSELAGLHRINEKNEEIVWKQRQIIWIAVSAVLLLSVLIVLLFGAQRRRLKAMNELEQLNLRLEENVAARTAHLVEANDSTRRNSEMLEAQNQKLTDFNQMITHNLRAPLANLSGLIALINDADETAEKQELINHLEPAVDSMKATVNELLQMVQFSQHNDPVSEPVLFSRCFEMAADNLKPQIDSAEATIETDFSNAPEVNYPCQYLHSLFHNLLTNSLKYRAEKRPLQIKVSTRKTENEVVLAFADNGLGIDLDKYGDRLFKAGRIFHQHPEAKGFGLYMTRMQVENAGGSIYVESATDCGATFFVHFPA